MGEVVLEQNDGISPRIDGIRQMRNIVQQHVHPKYRQGSAYFDIAVLEMDQPISITNYVRPICFNFQGDEDVDKYQDALVTVTGYGQISREANEKNMALQEGQLRVYSQE